MGDGTFFHLVFSHLVFFPLASECAFNKTVPISLFLLSYSIQLRFLKWTFIFYFYISFCTLFNSFCLFDFFNLVKHSTQFKTASLYLTTWKMCSFWAQVNVMLKNACIHFHSMEWSAYVFTTEHATAGWISNELYGKLCFLNGSPLTKFVLKIPTPSLWSNRTLGGVGNMQFQVEQTVIQYTAKYCLWMCVLTDQLILAL